MRADHVGDPEFLRHPGPGRFTEGAAARIVLEQLGERNTPMAGTSPARTR